MSTDEYRGGSVFTAATVELLYSRKGNVCGGLISEKVQFYTDLQARLYACYVRIMHL